MSKKSIESKFDSIVDFSGVEEFIDQPVKNYSSGMYVRLGFSVAIHVEPEILIVDEVLAVGDAEFQSKCLNKFYDFRAEGRTVILVTHSMQLIRDLCDSAAWLQNGKLRQVGNSEETVLAYEKSLDLR
jgi:ABC-type polysaccharide/polyol phosphate transport system ATPase subunit